MYRCRVEQSKLSCNYFNNRKNNISVSLYKLIFQISQLIYRINIFIDTKRIDKNFQIIREKKNCPLNLNFNNGESFSPPN